MLSRIGTVVLLVTVTCVLPTAVQAQSAHPILDLDYQLQPGVWHGFGLGPSNLDRAYVAEITPLSPSVGGAHIERYVVQPEFDGSNWNDVLRVMTPSGYPPLDANIRVYELVDMPVVQDFDFQLQPGVWHGFILGDCSVDRAFVVEISPQDLHVDGATIERYIVQPEFFASRWIDVLRLMLPSGYPPLDANLRTHELVDMPVVQDFDFQLQPGVWHGFTLGPSSLNRAYVPEFNPISDAGGLQTYVVQPEFDGLQWNDVLRVMTPAGSVPYDINIRVHKLPGSKAEIGLLTGDVEALQADEVLNFGQANALNQKLESVIRKLDRGNDIAAVNQLGAFVEQVEEMIASGVLTPGEGQVLIDSASAIVDELAP